MSDKEIKEFIDKLDAGLKLAEERMLKEKSLKGENVVVYTEGKGIQHIPASQIIAEKILN
ncbi:MAG: ribosome recycling factor [Muribaculaceae bacterium]|nr:ribosome recycling factor [Muribaculaceae bacterium]